MMTVNTSRLVEHFIELCKVDSESGNEKQICNLLFSQLEELGFQVTQLTVPNDLSNGYNIYARLEGTLDDSILVSSHMDTVTPGISIEPIIEEDIIRSKGETILGADDKSGIAAVMEAVRVIKANNLPHKTLELAFTVYEEGGLHGSKHYDMSYIQSKYAIVLDSGGPIGTVITQAPGQQNLKVTIKGKPAHAGLAPETGINALTVASDAITNMKLSRIDEETTANIGVVHGGEATNIVMPELYLEAEARSLNDEKLAKQVSHMVSTFEQTAKKHGTEAEIECERSYSAFQIDANHPLIKQISDTFTNMGIDTLLSPTGGGSDANIFNEKGLVCANLSTGMAKVHTTEEYIAISDMEKITQFLLNYLTN